MDIKPLHLVKTVIHHGRSGRQMFNVYILIFIVR